MKKRSKKMWIPNGITLIIIFGALCTGTKKAWDKHQAKKTNYITKQIISRKGRKLNGSQD